MSVDKCADKFDIQPCRVCLSPKKMFKSLFDEYNKTKIFLLINSVARVEIKEGDGFPVIICNDCFLELKTCITFKQKCEESNSVLNSKVSAKQEYSQNDDEKGVSIKKEESDDEYVYTVRATDFLECDYEPEEECKDTNDRKPFISKAIDLKLICNECRECFKTKCKLRVHWKKVHLPEALICKKCKRAFKSYKAFNKHVKKPSTNCKAAADIDIIGEGKKRLFKCKECNYSSRRIKDTITHLLVHTGEKPFCCELCSKAFSQVASLFSHKEIAHGQYKVIVNCQYCGQLVKGRNKVYKHLKTHTDNHHVCPICSKVLKSKKYLLSHMVRHKGIKEITCHICAKSFFTLAELSNHNRLIHRRVLPKHVFCHLCGYKTRQKYVLKKHMIRHLDASKMPCGICTMFFEDEEKLKRHQRNHLVKNFSCPHCDKKLATEKSLSSHISKKHRMTSKPRPNVINIEKPNVVIQVQNFAGTDKIKVENV